MLKRTLPLTFNDQTTNKKTKLHPTPSDVFSDENLVYEILKHTDAKTLGRSACVSKHWHNTAKDERLWEQICTKHWDNNNNNSMIGCGGVQLRTVVLALGGFRRLYSSYLLPLSRPLVSTKTSTCSNTVVNATSASTWPCLPSPPAREVVLKKGVVDGGKSHWGKDEMQLSLSLLSVRYFAKLSYKNRN